MVVSNLHYDQFIVSRKVVVRDNKYRKRRGGRSKRYNKGRSVTPDLWTSMYDPTACNN